MDMGTNGFYGDTFDSGFGSFETAKRRYIPTSSIHNEDMLAQRPRLDIFLIICTKNTGWVHLQNIAQHLTTEVTSGWFIVYIED